MLLLLLALLGLGILVWSMSKMDKKEVDFSTSKKSNIQGSLHL